MTSLFIHETGDPTGPPIVFLHGGGLSGRMWQPQMEALTEFRCLAPDLPEHGRSAAAGPFTLAGAAEAVIALIRAQTPARRAHLVGLSIGGAVGLEILCLAPDCVDKAMLSGPTPAFGRAFVTFTDAITGPLLRLLPRQWLIDMTIRSLGIPPRFRELVNDDLRQLGPELYRHINRAAGEVRLPQHPTPGALIVVGEHEPAISRRHAKKISRTVAGALVCQVRGVGHAWNLESPELFNTTLRAWLADAPLPPALERLG